MGWNPEVGRSDAASPSRDIAISFLRLANLDNELADRLSRYEASVWRQPSERPFIGLGHSLRLLLGRSAARSLSA